MGKQPIKKLEQTNKHTNYNTKMQCMTNEPSPSLIPRVVSVVDI